MVRGRKFLAARVSQAVQSTLGSSIIPNKRNTPPNWYTALAFLPPSEILTRPYPIQHTEPRDSKKAGKRPRNIFRPTRIVHPEDRLRQEFFRDHPWELARPRMILELDGQDARYRDWSKGLRQPGMTLSGERYGFPSFSPFAYFMGNI